MAAAGRTRTATTSDRGVVRRLRASHPSAVTWMLVGLYALCINLGSASPALAGTAARQRDLFPLPPLGTHSGISFGPDDIVQRRSRRSRDISRWAASAVDALNELAGRGRPTGGHTSAVVQQRTLTCVKDAFLRLPPPPPDIRLGKRALQDLLAACRLYCSERQDVQSYEKGRVSWPQVGAAPIDVLPLLPDADRAQLADWRQRLLRDPDEQLRGRQACGVLRPYMDPILRTQPRVYHDFITELAARGHIVFERTDSTDFTVGCFCVLKKSGSLRLVFDTRLANTQFIDPPVTALPSAAAFAAVEAEAIDDNRHCYMATADISNAFYNMMFPQDMWGCFSLPPVSTLSLPRDLRATAPAGQGRLLRPLLRVLPMGWTWALHMCQTVVEGITSRALGAATVLHDKEESRVLLRAQGPALVITSHGSTHISATYVDNVCVLATDPSAAAHGLELVITALRANGLPVHEITAPAEHQEFIGLELSAGYIRETSPPLEIEVRD